MPIPNAQHFYFKSQNGRYRVHIGCKGSLVLASCQGVSRLKMDVQKLMVERKHFGLKIHLLHGSREIVELIFFTNRAEVKEVRVRMEGRDLPGVPEAAYREGAAAPSSSDVGAATLVQAPPGMGLASDLSPPANLPSPETDNVLDRIAILTGSGEHPAVGRVSGGVPIPGNPTPSKGIRIDPALDRDIVPPLIGENEPTPAHALPPVPAIPKPAVTPLGAGPRKPSSLPPLTGSGSRPGAKSGLKPAVPTGEPSANKPANKSAPAKSGVGIAAKSGIAAAAQSSLQLSPATTPPAAASPSVAATPPAAVSPPVAGSPAQVKPSRSGVDPAVKPNKNAIAPEGDLQVPEGLDDLLAAADEIDEIKNGQPKKK